MNTSHLYIRISTLIIALLVTAQVAFAQNIILEITKQDVSCAGEEDGRAVVTAEGGQGPYQYLWSTGSTNQVIIDLSPGTYTVTVTDSAGNTAIDATGLFDLDSLGLVLETTDGACGNLGKVEAVVTGGVGPFQYKWSNGGFNTNITGLEQGTYAVTITDRNRCPIVDSIEVFVFGEGIKLDSDFTRPSCTGDQDGYISVSQIGAVLPVEFTWNNGQTGTSLENIPAGTYSVFAKDAFGCTDGLVFVLPDPEAVKVELFNQNDALIASVEGGTPDYNFEWSTGETGTSSINNLSPGDYSVTVEDVFGCSDVALGEVLAPLSTASIDELEQFDLSPTIVSQYFNINIQLTSTEQIQMQIIDPMGRKIWEDQFFAQDHNATISVPSAWSTGLYYLVIHSDSGWTNTKRFIKN